MRPSRPEPSSAGPSARRSYLPIVAGLVDVLLLVLALYFVQEGEAQRHAPETVKFFVGYPSWLLPVAYAAAAVMVTTLALAVLAAWRGTPLGRWSVAGMALGIILLIILTAGVGGPDAVRTIIDPSN